MISPNDLENGMVIKLDNDLYTVVSFQHIKPGKGGAFVRTRLKNIRLNTVIDRTFREIDKLEDVFLDQKKLQYLYRSGDTFNFMDGETFEEVHIDKNHLEEVIPYIKEGENITAYVYKGEIVSVSTPIFVNLKVVYTESGIRGDTAKGGSKSAKLETGLVLQVPLFINTDDTIKIDTRTGKYVERV